METDEIEIFRHSNVEIDRCANYISDIRSGADNAFYRQFILALRDAFNAYDTDLVKSHNEFFYFILFIAAIKVKWFTGITFSLSRPSLDSILLRSNNIAIFYH